jgi:asparagine synthetase B (glutamine-hydrolysing)
MLRDLLRNAVEKHIGPDTGVLLSGGIDSSTVAHFAPDLPLFTGYYQGYPYDERPWAGLVAKGREWHEIEITPDDFIGYLDTFLRDIHPPYEGPGAFGQYMVNRYVAEHVSTVLSGEGGDELFGGYARLHLVAGVPVPQGFEDYVLPDDYPRDLKEALIWEWTVNLPALLALDAQVTGAWGLKGIAPMAEDQAVITYAMNLPMDMRVGKVALKAAMRGLLPDEILNRKDKRGFPVPYVEWANGPLRDFIGDRLGYVPDPEKPWDRKWWNDLCAGQTALV